MHTSHLRRLWLSVAGCSVLAASIGVRAAEARSAQASPTRPDPEAVEFLLAAAAEDFRTSGDARPVAIRKARVGYFPEAGTGRYVLCGRFRPAAGTEWVQFATIKTSPYEQWIGGMAEAQCANKRIRWYEVDHANDLLRRIRGQ